MIIKSLARKRPGFKQLIGYIGRGGGEGFSRNLYGLEHPTGVAEAFEKNHALLPKRRNGNALYHEVIVLPPQPGLSRARQAAILHDLAQRYCELRAPDNLAWGRIHLDTDNSHIHLMISANAAQSKSRTRLSKARFAEIQIEMERETRAQFPDLQDRVIYDRVPDASRKSAPVREDAMIRAAKRPTRKSAIRSQFEAALHQSNSADDLARTLASHSLDLYKRGKHLGLRDTNTGARYRLVTLAVEDQLKSRQRDWLRRIEPEQTPETKAQPNDPKPDPRTDELLRQRQNQQERAERMLREFDGER